MYGKVRFFAVLGLKLPYLFSYFERTNSDEKTNEPILNSRMMGQMEKAWKIYEKICYLLQIIRGISVIFLVKYLYFPQFLHLLGVLFPLMNKMSDFRDSQFPPLSNEGHLHFHHDRFVRSTGNSNIMYFHQICEIENLDYILIPYHIYCGKFMPLLQTGWDYPEGTLKVLKSLRSL